MYAIVRTGGKQYRVEEGRSFSVERLPAEEGATVELSDVLLIAEDGQVTIGTPVIEGARVMAHVDAHGRDKKIIVFKYKSKVRTRKKTGHRQNFTKLTVEEILRPGQKAKAAGRPRGRRAAAEQPEAEGEVPEAPAEAPAEKPARRPRRPAAKPAAKAAPAAEKPKRRAARKPAEPKKEKPPARRRRTKKETE